MKKIFIPIISMIFICMSFSITFAQNPEIDKFITELEQIRNDLSTITKNMMCLENKSNEEINRIKQSINNNSSMIRYSYTNLNNLYKNESNISIRKQYSAISNTLSSYSYALDSLLLYLNSPNNIDQFLDAVYEIETGNTTLEDIKRLANQNK